MQAATEGGSEPITLENCYDMLTKAKKERLSALQQAAYAFMSDHLLEILREPAVYGRLSAQERDAVLSSRMQGLQTLTVAEVEQVYERAPGRAASPPPSGAPRDSRRTIFYYREATGEWSALTRMPDDVDTRGCAVCTMYNYLFVAGGIRGDGGQLSDRVFCYNPRTEQWGEVRPLNEPRSQLKLVSLDGALYAIGGECRFSVERYDPRADRWSHVAPLPKGAFAVAHEATTCDGAIYVSGGTLFYRLLKYDPKRDEWQECAYGSSRKRSADMVACRSAIYRFDVDRERGVSVSRYHTALKTWRDGATVRRGAASPFRCAVLGDCVYCVSRSQTLRCFVREDGARFAEEPLAAPPAARGVLLPFVLVLPHK